MAGGAGNGGVTSGDGTGVVDAGAGARGLARWVLVAPAGAGFELLPIDAVGQAAGEVTWVDDLALGVSALEREAAPRWVWWRTAEVYPALLEAGVRVQRCHDLAAAQNLLNTYEGAAFVPPQSVVRESAGRSEQISLFGDEPGSSAGGAGVVGTTGGPDTAGHEEEVGRTESSGGRWVGTDGPDLDAPQDDLVLGSLVTEQTPLPSTREAPQGLAELQRLYAGQVAHVARVRRTHPGFALLVAAESAAGLAAVEMGRAGLPWSVRIHDEVLTDLLGPRPQHHGRPPKLQALAEEVSRLLVPGVTGPGPAMNPDSPGDVLKAFKRQGVLLTSTRAWELKEVEHPAVAPLLRYKELARLHVAHGWSWQGQWVRNGRFHPEYVPGGVVTGRWATSGGGALQIPKVMRACVVAEPGCVLVAADAGQLEPRILAALSGDRGMLAATADADMYTALARQALGRPEARNEAKIGLLAAMYGARANTPAMVALRRRFPKALELLERAARTGEDGGIVRSVLGRTCPPPDPTWQDVPLEQALARSRARGRFTRNFVIQASAADWANALVAGLRRRLSALSPAAELVFFQHDEVIVHVPAALAEAAVQAVVDSGAEATALVLGDRGVRIPLAAAPIASYADKN
ncbi:DNA polymerase I [Kineosporia sp. NBRC 101677]|nr:DNA polymerase I [Kineosporia sp. NBRC 101677]